MTAVAVVGLGALGRQVAARLAAFGQPLLACDPDPGARAAFAALVSELPLAELAKVNAEADIVLTCLSSVEAVRGLCLDDGPRSLAGLRRGAIVIELSTLPPALAIAASAALAARGVDYLEAPVFGGPAAAAAGTLHLALAGEPGMQAPDGDVRESLRPLLRQLAGGWHWIGPPGSAMTVKVLQNGLGLVQLAAMGEAAVACRASGIAPEVFHALVLAAKGMAASPLFAERFLRMARGDGEVQARLEVGRKDAVLYLDLVDPHRGVPSLASASARAFAAAVAAGYGEHDVTAVVEAFTGDRPRGDDRQ